MISAQNLLQLLNGSKISLAIVLACICFSSCDALKKVPREEKPKNEELDEIQSRRVYNPKTDKWEYSTDVTETIDTVQWKNPTDSAPPIVSEGAPVSTIPGIPTTTRKDIYNVAMMLPFMTNNFDELSSKLSDRSQLAINFYAGVKMAFDELSKEGVKLNITVHDTQASESVTKSLLLLQSLQNADLIIGPVARSNLQLVADFAKANRKPMVCPLSPSVTITSENPYYVQVNPGLEAHCETITRHALANYSPDQIVLVARNKKAETDRFKYFQETNQKVAGGSFATPFKEFIVTDNTADFSEMDASPYIVEGKTTVFIVPSWSNESFVYSLLRNISIAKGKNNVVVYGMPQWMNFEQISFDYYENLHLHVSSNSDLNPENDDILQFRKNFFYKYGTVPTEQAFIGYDVMQYFGNQLYRSGTQFQVTLDQAGEDLLHTRFQFDPVAPANPVGEDYSKVDRYENKYVNILQFKNYFFQLAD